MKQKFLCWNCKKENEFETSEEKKLLLEMKLPKEKPDIYIVKCQHCGAKNRVEVYG
ncbi:MAG: hypothetical protein ABIL44_07830 [candidate division WOR-3 bacterium]